MTSRNKLTHPPRVQSPSRTTPTTRPLNSHTTSKPLVQCLAALADAPKTSQGSKSRRSRGRPPYSRHPHDFHPLLGPLPKPLPNMGASLETDQTQDQTKISKRQKPSETLSEEVQSLITSTAKEDFAQAWLRGSYSSCPDNNICLQDVYTSYCNICEQQAVPSLGVSFFQKEIKFCFPGVRRRRLRVGGKTQYHYGIRRVDTRNTGASQGSSSTPNYPTSTPGSGDNLASYQTNSDHNVEGVSNLDSCDAKTSLTAREKQTIKILHVAPFVLDSVLPADVTSIEMDDICPVYSGGYCEIFIGYHLPTRTKLAMKRLRIKSDHPKDAAATVFHREANLWSSFSHTNLLPFYGIMDSRDWMYLVSPWMERGSLSKLIRNRAANVSQMNGVELIDSNTKHAWFNETKMILEIASGIAYLHSKDFVHGDLRCGNVLLAEDGHALLCDFGLTKALDASGRSIDAENGVQSLRWQSPELFDNLPKSLKSDVYAFAMMIVEILTGDAPFPDLSIMRFINVIVYKQERPPFIPLGRQEINFEPLWRIASKCWRSLPQDRPTMNDVLRDLQHIPSLVPGDPLR